MKLLEYLLSESVDVTLVTSLSKVFDKKTYPSAPQITQVEKKKI